MKNDQLKLKNWKRDWHVRAALIIAHLHTKYPEKSKNIKEIKNILPVVS